MGNSGMVAGLGGQSNNSGSARVKTVATRRWVVPAIRPGELNGTSNLDPREYFMGKIRGICASSRDHPMPPFEMRTSRMDRWLLRQLMDERTSFLSAFLDQASMIQSNRNYRITGTRNMVNRILHFLHMSEGGDGFRKLIKMTALNFYSSNHGGTVYLLRDRPTSAQYLPDIDRWQWVAPPVVQMFATDPIEFEPRNDYVYPFEYSRSPWSRYDFFRIVSMPSTELRTWGVGRCPLFRCIQIARMTSAIYEHIFNLVSPDTAKGILVVKGMSDDEFVNALVGSDGANEQDAAARRAAMFGDDLGDVVVLADRDQEIQVNFTLLSRLPEGFFLDNWIRWTLTAFAVALGFPLDEFIGHSSSPTLLGQSGAEVDAGVQRGGTKGGSEFINQVQEAIQTLVMPPTVHFVFGDRDESAELSDLVIRERKAKMVVDLFQATQIQVINRADEVQDTLLEAKARGSHIIDSTEARRLLVEIGVLPEWITQSTESITVDDQYANLSQYRLKHLREQARETQQVQRLAADPTGEPVIQYESWVDKDTGIARESTITLWSSDEELGRASVWNGSGPGEWGKFNDTLHPSASRQRVTNRDVNLDYALNSDHAHTITKLLSKILKASVADYIDRCDKEGISDFSLKNSLYTQASENDRESLISRIYAVAQMGQDNVIKSRGAGKNVYMQMTGRVYQYARAIVSTILGDDSYAGDSDLSEISMPLSYFVEDTLGDLMQERAIETVEAARAAEAATIYASDAQNPMSRLPELNGVARSLARSYSDYMVTRSFGAGQQSAAEALGARRKTWRASCEHHVVSSGKTVQGLYEPFAHGECWAGMSMGCLCEVKVS
jgi:hypothetical protein